MIKWMKRIGKINALFKPRADTGQPVMSPVCRVPHTGRKALGARRRGAALTIDEDRAVCQVNTSTSALDLAAIVAALSDQGVTDETTLWIEAWGGAGAHGNVTQDAGSGGASGYAQSTTTVNAVMDAYGTSELYYYLGDNGTYGHNSGGDGGTATLVTTNDLTRQGPSIDETLLIAGGGGGGGGGRQDHSSCNSFFNVVGEDGGGGGTAIVVPGLTADVTQPGGAGGNHYGNDLSGHGGTTTSGGQPGDTGNPEAGDGPLAPLGGAGGGHTDEGGPHIGFVNQSGTMVTTGGGRGGQPGDKAGGGGGGGGYTGGGGGAEGDGNTGCISGAGGGGASFAARIGTASCSAAPTSKEANPNGAEGFIRISFDLGACG